MRVIFINSGILAILIIIVMAILISTDWFSTLISGVGKRKVIIYLILILFTFYLNLPITNGWKVSIGGFIIPLITYLKLVKGIKEEKIYLLSATILLGATYFLFKEIIRLDPILLFWDELYQLSLILVLIILIIASSLKYKITLFFGGMLLGEFIFNYHHRNDVLVILLGNDQFKDLFWLGLIQIFFFYYVFMAIKQGIKRISNINIIKIR